MMLTATSLTSTGLRDWLVQRFSAIVLGLYFIFLMGFFIGHHHQLSYQDWQALFSHPAMRIFSFLALLSLVAHSWVGIWTVLTDYVKCMCVRLFLEAVMVLALVAFLVWGVEIIWSI